MALPQAPLHVPANAKIQGEAMAHMPVVLGIDGKYRLAFKDGIVPVDAAAPGVTQKKVGK